MRAPFAPPRLSEPRKVDAEAQAVDTSWETESPESRSLAFSACDFLLINQRMIHGRNGILPRQTFFRNFRAEITDDGPMSR